jgi:hypothetical protein
MVLVVEGLDRPADRWEFRSSGLWAQVVCESPGSHWSYGLEAFALAVDDPSELLGRGYGDRVALGWELDFHSSPSRATPGVGVGTQIGVGTRIGVVDQVGEVDGLLLTTPDPIFGDDPSPEVPLEGSALRRHWWSNEPVDDAEMLAWFGHLDIDLGSPGRVALPLESGAVWWVGTDGVTLTSQVEPAPAGA